MEVSLLTILPFTYPLTYRPTPETQDVGSAGASPGWHSLQCSLLITNHNNPKIETSAKEVSLLTILPFTCPATYKSAADSWDVGSAGAPKCWHFLQHSHQITSHKNPETETSAVEVSLLTMLPFTCLMTYKHTPDTRDIRSVGELP